MVKNKRSKPKNKTAEISEKKVGELVALAHQGTMESIKKISDFTKTAKNKNLKAMAEIAKDEAEYFYYSPTSEQEEKDLLLAKIIRDREDHLTMDLKCQAGAAKFELEKLDLKVAVFNNCEKPGIYNGVEYKKFQDLLTILS